ncbi:FUSC family protein [Pantoea stewartii]|uniref:Integral membrane bound transporter domain-containing protein n=1 Tax=Pantoea stewartii TaxID=66269 RepID=A0AB34VG90_9GAMM|nr:FUSC family protein [Pantoea stewartii]KTS73511.1 hypothetical protein RSA30_09700 [Pantoea stewartii]KTS96689.1 hypothetical protein RSA13_13780 [Pantoea stewartii]KTT06174.1 hypothetical protein RSA36_16515 [Pantoea stewartii]
MRYTCSPVKNWFGENINLSKIYAAIINLLPTIMLYSVFSDENWQQAMLVSISTFIVQDRLKSSPVMVIIHSVMISVCFLAFINVVNHAFLFSVICSSTAAFTLRLAGWGNNLRVAGSFTFIPALYLAFEFNKNLPDNFSYTCTLPLLLYIWVATLPTLVLSFFHQWRVFMRSRSLVYRHKNPELGEKLEYKSPLIACAIAVFLCSMIVESEHILQGQWLIWSAVSVITGEIKNSHRKYQSRAIGVAAGGLAGMLIGTALPHNAFLIETGAIVTVLSLVSFKNYTLEYFIRCTSVAFVVTLLDEQTSLIFTRAFNVLVGGLTGVLLFKIVEKTRSYRSVC